MTLAKDNLLANHVTPYRIVAAVGFILAVVLALVPPVHMSEPDDWAYYYGVTNFAQGRLTVDTALHNQQVSDARQKGGSLIQYVNIGNNAWALEKAPGYVFYLVPFQRAGIPRWGNVLLALGMAVVTFIFLRGLRDEKTACIGTLLMLLTPVSLAMLNRAYMDTFAAGAFLTMGGGLYLHCMLEGKRLRPAAAGALLFGAFLLTSYSVVTRYTNVTVAAVFALHFVITRAVALYRGDRRSLRFEVPAVLLGAVVPAAILLAYDTVVFGSPLDYGYHYSQFPIKFAFQHLGQVDRAGQSMPWQIILGNLQTTPRYLIMGLPLLALALPGLGLALYYRLRRAPAPVSTSGRWSSLRREISWENLALLSGWFLGVFALYMTYEWTANLGFGRGSFMTIDRFYLPGLFPVAAFAALIVARFPAKLSIAVLMVTIAVGAWFYVQSLNARPLPGGRGPGGLPGNPPAGGAFGGLPPPGMPYGQPRYRPPGPFPYSSNGPRAAPPGASTPP